MNTVERLQEYYDFDQSVLDGVAQAADEQNRLGFLDLAQKYGIESGPELVAGSRLSRPFEILTLKPDDDYNEDHARILHLPMSMPIDASMAMRSLRLFASDPTEQLIVVGNPGAIGNKTGKLRARVLWPVARGDLSPTVKPLLNYLYSHKIKTTDQLGYSYGADKAATASSCAADYDILVNHGVWVEAAACLRRGPIKLVKDFSKAGADMNQIVQSCASPPLMEARAIADTGVLRYLGGLARLSNLAIGGALAYDGFIKRAAEALKRQPDMRAMLAWGTLSRLTDSSVMENLTVSLRQNNEIQRVGAMVVRGMSHGGGDDIDLHAAIMLQGLRG